MQISLKWINELISIENVNLDELINKLTLGGFEVEEILEVEIDNNKTITLDVSATANRSDSLSIQGIGLEIAALLNCGNKISNYINKNFNWSQEIESISKPILNNNSCSTFIALTVKNLTTVTSPKWLKQKLLGSGIIPENNLIDFQNYLLLETGYPFEFYDLDKIHSQLNTCEFTLSLISDKNSKNFCASNGIEYKLNDSILLLNANQFPISIAGIIPTQKVSYSDTTQSLLIEGSIFNAAKIRQQSRHLGLRTDRSSRYEKSLKNTNLLESFYHLICLLRIQNPNLVCKLHTIAQPSEELVQIISLNYQTVKKVLGPIKKTKFNEYEYISPKIITDCLERLQFQVICEEPNLKWKIIIPDLRSDDIIREIDLIEEIGRLYGFNNFLTRLPKIKEIGTEDFYSQTRKKLTSCLLNLGLNELIQYSLVNQKTYLNNEIQLINPLVKDYSSLRSSLLPNLLKAVEENVKNANLVLEGFEYGHVFFTTNSAKIIEKEHVAGIFGGLKTKLAWSESSNQLNWFEAKGKIDQLFMKLNISIYWEPYILSNEKTILHPYCAAKLHLINGDKLGIFGKINFILAKKLNLSADTYLFEFDFKLIQNQIQKNKIALSQEYSLYPKITKDLSFIIHNNISFKKIKEILYLNGSQFLTEINLLDEYQGTSIPNSHISLCLQLIFQSNKKTLQTKEIETIMDNLKMVLSTKFNATIRV